MEKFKYGPLIYITYDMDDSEGNYYWNGNPPVAYDSSGVPIDKNGLQCLDISCPLHPNWEPKELGLVPSLGIKLPSLDYARSWFEDNFLNISDNQLKKIIIRWLSNNCNHEDYYRILKTYSSVEEIQEAVWPQDEQTS